MWSEAQPWLGPVWREGTQPWPELAAGGSWACSLGRHHEGAALAWTGGSRTSPCPGLEQWETQPQPGLVVECGGWRQAGRERSPSWEQSLQLGRKP